MPTPKLVKAPEAVEAPVPPCETATSVASQTPVTIVPRPVICDWEASTLSVEPAFVNPVPPVSTKVVASSK